MSQEIELNCSVCKSGVSVDGPSWPETARCRCGGETPLRFTEAVGCGRGLDRCPVCDVDLFYVQKDFNRVMGCSIVATGALLFILLPNPWSYIAMGATALFDYVLYIAIPWVTVCYKCRSIFRGFPRSPEHKAFDLNVAEQFAK